MSISLLFWVIFIVYIVFGFYSNWPASGKGTAIGGHLVVCILLALLGWAVFGAAIHR